MTIYHIMLFFGIMLFGFFLRWMPHRMASGGLGVDHWYWKLYLETYWRERRFPPELPQFLLEEYQWYPPLFIMIVARLPRVVFERYSHLIGLVVDLVRMALAMVLAAWLSNGNTLVMGVAGLVYATTPVMVSYNVQLNPRGLAALFLDLQVLAVLMLVGPESGPWWLWGVVWLLGALVLLCHKMTTQLMCFLAFAGALATGDWRIIIVIPASILTAWVLSGGFYRKVLLAHWDAVSFWYRNWPWLMAHPVKESPVYGDPGYLTPTRFYQPGLKGMLRHVRYFIAYNPWAWFLLPIFVLLPSSGFPLLGVYAWLAATLLFGVLTVVVHQCRCLGSGYLYVYNTALPSALLWGAVMAHPRLSVPVWLLVLMAIIISLAAIAMFYRNVLTSQTLKVDENFEALIGWLTKAERGVVMCLPVMWYDVIAYRTAQSVFYGGHAYGFKLFQLIIPRLMVSMRDAVKNYQVRYLVTVEGYLNEKFINDLRFDRVLEFGPYRVFCLRDYD